MLDTNESSFEIKNVFYEPDSIFPIDRLNELRELLHNYPDDWGIILIKLYPMELRKLLIEFPELNFAVLDDKSNISTIFCRIARMLN